MLTSSYRGGGMEARERERDIGVRGEIERSGGDRWLKKRVRMTKERERVRKTDRECQRRK